MDLQFLGPGTDSRDAAAALTRALSRQVAEPVELRTGADVYRDADRIAAAVRSLAGRLRERAG